MIKFHITDPIKNPDGFIQEALRAYHIVLAVAVGNGVVPIPEATDAKVHTIDDDTEDVFVHFEDRMGNTITSFELAYRQGGYWYICDYCDGVLTGSEGMRSYAGTACMKYSDFRKLQETLEQIVEIEHRKMLRANRAKYGKVEF